MNWKSVWSFSKYCFWLIWGIIVVVYLLGYLEAWPTLLAEGSILLLGVYTIAVCTGMEWESAVSEFEIGLWAILLTLVCTFGFYSFGAYQGFVILMAMIIASLGGFNLILWISNIFNPGTWTRRREKYHQKYYGKTR